MSDDERRQRRGRSAREDSESSPMAYAKWVVRAVVVTVLAIAAWKIVPPWMQAQEAQPLWNQAVDAANAQNYDEAIRLLDEAKAKAPDWKELQQKYPEEVAKYYIGKAFKHKDAGEDQLAVEAFEKAFANNPKAGVDNGSYYSAAQCYLRLGKFQKALEKAKLEIEYSGSEAAHAPSLVKHLVDKMTKAVLD